MGEFTSLGELNTFNEKRIRKLKRHLKKASAWQWSAKAAHLLLKLLCDFPSNHLHLLIFNGEMVKTVTGNWQPVQMCCNEPLRPLTHPFLFHNRLECVSVRFTNTMTSGTLAGNEAENDRTVSNRWSTTLWIGFQFQFTPLQP